MKTKGNLLRICLLGAVLLPAVVQGQFAFTTNNDAITITAYTGPGGAVIIPDRTNGYPVTGIGDFAFWYRTNLTVVTIPAGITNLGNALFAGCRALTNVTLANGITLIGASMFAGCSQLPRMIIPDSVTTINTYAFEQCTS